MNPSRFLLRVYFAGQLALELIEGREDCGDGLLQRRHVLFDDCPDLLRIHALVLVDEDVAHATESAPRDLWMRRAVTCPRFVWPLRRSPPGCVQRHPGPTRHLKIGSSPRR